MIRLIRRATQTGLVTLAGVLAPWSAQAAIIGTGAVVSVRVQELLDEEPASVSSDSDILFVDAAELPITAATELVAADLEGTTLSFGRGLSRVADPTRLDQADPEEFTLEAAAYAESDRVSYGVTTEAEESRTIIFTTPGSSIAPTEIDFTDRSTAVVESSVFIRGVLVVWSTAGSAGLDDVIAEMRLTVVRDGDETPLFEAAVSVSGNAEGGVVTSIDGPIRVETVSVDELVEAGLSAESAVVLRSLENAGAWHLFVLPPQEHAYTYAVTADEPLVLRARFTAEARNAPLGTGAFAAWGDAFVNLGNVIDDAVDAVDGQAIAGAIVETLVMREVGLVSIDGEPVSQPQPGSCGVFGIEMLGGAVLSFLSFLSSRRRYCGSLRVSG